MKKAIIGLAVAAALFLSPFATVEAGQKICLNKVCKKIGPFVKICVLVPVKCPILKSQLR